MEVPFKLALLVAVVILAKVQESSGQCQINVPNPGAPTLPRVEFLEDVAVGMLAEYTSNITSLTVPDPNGQYVQFTFDPPSRNVRLDLLKPLSESLDAGSNELQYVLSATCDTGDSFPITFTVLITDLNDRAPEFELAEYPLQVQTPWPTDVPINFKNPITVTDTDFMIDNARVTFSADHSDIKIVATAPPDGSKSPFEYTLELILQNGYQFTVDTTFTLTATDGTHTETASVNVQVTEENRYPPQFNEPVYKSAGKIIWPPVTGDVIDVNINVEDRDDTQFIVEAVGSHEDLVDITTTGGVVTLTFKNIPDDLSAFDDTNGVAIIELLARETQGTELMESKSVVILVFEIPPVTVTTEPPVTCEPVTCEPCSSTSTGTTEPPPTCEPCASTSFGTTEPASTCEPVTCDPCTSTSLGTTEPSPTCEPVTCDPCTSTSLGTTEPPPTCKPCSSTSSGTTDEPFPTCEPCDPCASTSLGTTPAASTCEPVDPCEPCTCTPAPVTGCPDPGECICPTTQATPGGGGDDDDDCENGSSTGYIVGIVVTAVLFVIAAAAAVYLWTQLRKARMLRHLTPMNVERWDPPHQQPRLSKTSFGSIAQPVVVSKPPVINSNGNVTAERRPSILKRTSFESSPPNDFGKQPEHRNSIVTQAKNPHVENTPIPAAATPTPSIPIEPVPPIPQPDYRTKPDYKVKINETVEIVEPEEPQYSDNDNEASPNSGANSDVEANGGAEDERL